jgi:ABC-type cobalamin/Fe3+-siderophores transport system ATPase subunit
MFAAELEEGHYMRLTNIKVERFKRLENVVFDVDSVNILIGGNNSGKSTIIQAAHFAFTLLQSLNISNKWPAKEKRSSTVSPSELIYIPSEDPYSLGFGGRLLEDEKRSITVSFAFDTGDALRLAIRKGRITNIIVEPDNIEFAKTLSSLEAPYSVFSPGLAGVSRTENYVSDGVLLRALARGDANIVLRNILYRLREKPEWANFEEDLGLVFPQVRLEVTFDRHIDQYIDVKSTEGERAVPLDLAGTGLLQAIQILAYLHLFAPKLMVLDEPDSHLHPNNQRLLCSLLTTVAVEREVQVIMTTHSRHVLDAMYNQAKILWVQNGSVVTASPEDQVEILLELGALDVKEKIQSGKFKAVVLTEDAVTSFLSALLRNSGFDSEKTSILPYSGITNVNLLKPLVKQIKDVSNATIIVHRDRDYLEAEEIADWKKQIRAIGAEPFVTSEMDIEGYFCSDDYLALATKGHEVEIDALKSETVAGQEDDIISSYVNGRIDQERKAGTIGKLNTGKLSAAVAKKVASNSWGYMKGKRKLARLRFVCGQKLGFKYHVDLSATLPVDKELSQTSTKIFHTVKGN